MPLFGRYPRIPMAAQVPPNCPHFGLGTKIKAWAGRSSGYPMSPWRYWNMYSRVTPICEGSSSTGSSAIKATGRMANPLLVWSAAEGMRACGVTRTSSVFQRRFPSTIVTRAKTPGRISCHAEGGSFGPPVSVRGKPSLGRPYNRSGIRSAASV